MTTMGAYCKAYSLGLLRTYTNWSENADNARVVTTEDDGQENEAPRDLTDDDYVYLQENYVVTDGIYKDENVIFEDVTPEWIEFCKQELEFEVPADVRTDNSTTDPTE